MSAYTKRIIKFVSLTGMTLAATLWFGVCISYAAQGSRVAVERLYDPKAIDLSNVVVSTTKLGENLYAIQGGPGSTVGLLIGPDGIFLVDTNYSQLGPKIDQEIRKLSSAPIRFLVNTHIHPDHMDGNEEFAKHGTVIIGRDELRTRLIHGLMDNLGYRPPAPVEALPVITYGDSLSVHMDGEDIELIAIPHAHTDGDTMVRFRNADVIMTGDVFRVTNGYPGADANTNGSIQGIIHGLDMAIAMTGPRTKIIPGHGRFSDRSGIIAQRDMVASVWDRVAGMVAQGKTMDEIIAARLTAEFDSGVDRGKETADRFVKQIYAEIRATTPIQSSK